jgi:hypothetical protein
VKEALTCAHGKKKNEECDSCCGGFDHASPQIEQTSNPEETPKPVQFTRKMWKEYMRVNFTVRRDIVRACGHKLSHTTDPRTNCESCWFAYFNTNGQMTQIADECFNEAGRDVLERSRGKNFVKQFLKFMSTVARFQREAAEAAEKEKANGEVVSGGGNNSNGCEGTGSVQITGEPQTIGGIRSDSGYTGYQIAEGEDGEATVVGDSNDSNTV